MTQVFIVSKGENREGASIHGVYASARAALAAAEVLANGGEWSDLGEKEEASFVCGASSEVIWHDREGVDYVVCERWQVKS